MTKYSFGNGESSAAAKRSLFQKIERLSLERQLTFDEVRDNQRLRRLLKHAVCREQAPQSLIDSIRSGIRG